VKHATPLAGITIEQAASDTWHRGLADALIVSGTATGARTEPDRIRKVRAAVPDALIWVGSGMTKENARELLRICDGAIIGSALAHDDVAGGGVAVEKVKAMTEIFDSLRPDTGGIEWDMKR
jgi:predicted TIM-barrel enzyme